MKRRICWPNPDGVCLEGGCIWCGDYPFRSERVIREYAVESGLLRHLDEGLHRTGGERGWRR